MGIKYKSYDGYGEYEGQGEIGELDFPTCGMVVFEIPGHGWLTVEPSEWATSRFSKELIEPKKSPRPEPLEGSTAWHRKNKTPGYFFWPE